MKPSQRRTALRFAGISLVFALGGLVTVLSLSAGNGEAETVPNILSFALGFGIPLLLGASLPSARRHVFDLPVQPLPTQLPDPTARRQGAPIDAGARLKPKRHSTRGISRKHQGKTIPRGDSIR